VLKMSHIKRVGYDNYVTAYHGPLAEITTRRAERREVPGGKARAALTPAHT